MRTIHQQFKRSMLCLAICSVIQFAQANEVADITNAEEKDKIEVIMVTAQKRIQRIIDVPTSIASVDAKSISNSSSQQLSDIQDLVPNLSIQDLNSWNNQVSIRGVGASSRNISFDTRVGVYLDGVYLGQSPGINQDLVDIERIEVLRGPQGSLFGKNTVAGAINIITKKPSDELEGTIKARIGNYNAQQYTGYVNLPIADDIAFKVSGSYVERDGFVNNIHPDATADVGDRNSTNYRAQLYVGSFGDLELTFTLDDFSAKETPFSGEAVTDFIGAGPVESQAKPDRVTYTNFLPTEDRSHSGLALEAVYNLSNGSSIKSITAQRDTKLDFWSDFDYSSLDFLTLRINDEYEQFTQEFQYTSNTGTNLEYIVGLYYYQQDSYTNRVAAPGAQMAAISDSTLLAGTLAAFGLSTFVGTPFEGLYPSDTITNIGSADTESYAIFSNITYKLSDKWELGLGLRWGRETKKVDWAVNGENSGYFGIATSDVIDELSDSNFLPSFSVNFDINNNNVAYFRVATGSKSGGWNLDFVTEEQLDFLAFDKETSTNYEIGVKGYNNDYTFRYSLSVFSTHFEDYQQLQYIDLGDSRTIIALTNAASVITDGLELEMSYDVNDHFTVGLSLGLLDARFDKFENGGTPDDLDVSGNRLPGAPEVQSTLSMDYNNELSANLTWFAHADVSYIGDSYLTANNVKTYTTIVTQDEIDFGYVPSRNSVNLRLGIESEQWRASLWARNALDSDDLVSSRRQFLGAITQSLNNPRTYGVELSYNF
ncbi:MAG: TonB-dependent receptor [Alteromonadales bacterium]|nr:TonB-dependent receptor [Alteromonadales bacterium]